MIDPGGVGSPALIPPVGRQDVEIRPLLAGIENPVLSNSARLILGELLAPIPQTALGRNDFHGQVGRTIEIGGLEPVEVLPSHKQQVGFPAGQCGPGLHLKGSEQHLAQLVLLNIDLQDGVQKTGQALMPV